MAQRQFQIITDSSCDMPESYYAEHDIDVVKLGFFLNGETYSGEDGKEMGEKEFYDIVRGGAMPTTYQAPGEVSREHAEKYLAAGKDVLIVGFSSGLSGTCSGMIVAARELAAKYPERQIMVTDSLAASMGEGLYLDYIIKKADSGASLKETFDYAESLKLNICHMFTVDDLFHLKRGGRVSAATAVVGTLLNIKPVLHVDDEGHLIALDKAVGRKKSIRALVEYMDKVQLLGEDDPIFISHGDCEADANYLKGILLEKYGADRRIEVNCIGPVIGAHAGPGTIALFYKGSKR